MDRIPEHKISDKFHGRMVFLKYISADNSVPIVDYVHRDDYYLFLFIEKGEVRLSVDFEEYDIKGPAVHCVLPGQVHQPIAYNENCKSWVLIADSMLVKQKFRVIFENASLIKNKAGLDEDTVSDLKCCASILHRRLNEDEQPIEQDVVHSLLSAYIGIIAEAHRKGSPASTNKRYAVIAHQFKDLLSVNYKTIKSPSQYAYKLNISPVYLNEAVKKATGLTVTECIQNEVTTQAKRLLFYTDLNVRQIAAELGYDDCAYFTRLFTKVSSLSPTEFRAKYLK